MYFDSKIMNRLWTVTVVLILCLYLMIIAPVEAVEGNPTGVSPI